METKPAEPHLLYGGAGKKIITMERAKPPDRPMEIADDESDGGG